MSRTIGIVDKSDYQKTEHNASTKQNHIVDHIHRHGRKFQHTERIQEILNEERQQIRTCNNRDHVYLTKYKENIQYEIQMLFISFLVSTVYCQVQSEHNWHRSSILYTLGHFKQNAGTSIITGGSRPFCFNENEEQVKMKSR
jgi:hypothetical protein